MSPPFFKDICCPISRNSKSESINYRKGKVLLFLSLKQSIDEAKHNTVVMEQTLENYDVGLIEENVREKKTNSGEKSNKCNQCDYASSRADVLRRHLIIHSGEKPHKCNQCDYTSSRASDLRRHLKAHSGEKSNKSSDL